MFFKWVAQPTRWDIQMHQMYGWFTYIERGHNKANFFGILYIPGGAGFFPSTVSFYYPPLWLSKPGGMPSLSVDTVTCQIVTGSFDKTAKLWDANTGQCDSSGIGSTVQPRKLTWKWENMGKQPFEDVSPIRNGDVPAGHSLVFRGV